MQSDAFYTPTPGKGEVARRRLLQAALQVFGDKGLKGATVREIAQKSRLNVAAISYYYGDKEGLYRAVVDGIVRELRHQLADVVKAMQQFRQQKAPTREEAIRLVKLFLRSVYLRLLSRNDVMSMGRVVIREQTQPTEAFEILYNGAFREFHETMSLLVGTALGVNQRDRRVIIRTHSLLGQVWFFALGRETILRRLGWKDLEGEHGEQVCEILMQNVDLLLATGKL